MDCNQQCCDSNGCPDVGKSHQGNIKVYSYKERRYYCVTCGHTFSASRGSTFYRLHTDRQDFIEAVGMSAERCSLRGERNDLTMRQNVGRLVRKTLSFSKSVHYLQRHIALEDAVYNFVKPHRSLRRPLCESSDKRREWEQRTPAMAAGLTDHVWSIEELLEFHD